MSETLANRICENAEAIREDIRNDEEPNRAYLEQIVRDAQELLNR